MAWTSPRTWVSGEVLTAALLNTHVRDNLKAVGDAWTAYTPTWSATVTPPTIGNGTLTGHAMQAGKMVHYRIALTFGSTTTVGSGVYTFTAPVAAKITAHQPAGIAQAFDTSATAITMLFARFNNSATQIVCEQAVGTDVTDASPYAWAAGDTLIITGTYEAA